MKEEEFDKIIGLAAKELLEEEIAEIRKDINDTTIIPSPRLDEKILTLLEKYKNQI